MPSASLSILLGCISVLDRLLLANVIVLTKGLSGVMSLRQVIPSLICNSPAKGLLLIPQFLSIVVLFHHKNSCMHLS